MKTLLTTILLLVAIIGAGQATTDTLNIIPPRKLFLLPNIKNFDIVNLNKLYVREKLIVKDLDIVTWQDVEDYLNWCEKDTIVVEKFGDEYVRWHESYGEMFSEKQLNHMGYKYEYRWITEIDSLGNLEIEYHFKKEPTLKGFIKWKEKKRYGK